MPELLAWFIVQESAAFLSLSAAFCLSCGCICNDISSKDLHSVVTMNVTPVQC